MSGTFGRPLIHCTFGRPLIHCETMLDYLWKKVDIDEDLKALRYKLLHLEAIQSDTSTWVENEEIQPGKKRKSEVELWCERVKEKKIAVEQIETEFQEKGTSKDLKNRIGKHIKDVDELIQWGKFPKGVVLNDHASTILALVTTELVGQSSDKNIAFILSWIKEDGVFAIGIHGMGGVGKTTLIKHVHNKLLEDPSLRKKVYWVTASQECSLQKLQTDIGKAIGLGDLSEHHNGERRKSLLSLRFRELEKFVLIIDDLWKHFLIEDIGIPCNLNGSKMIVTTRSLEVCNKMMCHTIEIEPLSRPDAMNLFVKTLGREVSIKLNPMAEKIVDKCGGLPLALKTMGCSMRGKTEVYEWKSALCELLNPEIRQDEMEEHVFQVLQYSYKNLKDEKLQHCFLSCVLFPEDHKIEREELVKLWINEGLLDEVESEEDKENRGQAILNRLERSCLLESVNGYWNIKCVKMHDLIRDMAIIITKDTFMAKSGTNLKKMPGKESWSEDLLKVSLGWNDIEEIPSDLSPMTMKLSVLLLNSNYYLRDIPELFFVHMKSLRVLDLSSTRIQRLLDSVSKLENLRVLLLSGNSCLTYMPSLEKLMNLRVLDLSDTGIERLPDGVSNLENLRELRLSKCINLTYVPSLARLSNLTVINLSYTPIERLPDGVLNLVNLRELRLQDCYKLTYVPSLARLTNLTVINLSYTPIERLPDGVLNLVNLRELRLRDCYKLTYVPSLARFTNLRVLDLQGNRQLVSAPGGLEGLQQLEEVMGCPWDVNDMSGFCRVVSSWPSLTRYSFILKQPSDKGFFGIDEFHDYEKRVWIRGAEINEDETVWIPNTIEFLGIEKSEMKGIRGWGDLFPYPAENLECKNICIAECRGVEYIASSSCPLHSVKKLYLLLLPDLREIVEFGCSRSFSMLVFLSVYRCHKLKVVFSLSKDQLNLPNLRRLEVDACEEVEQIFESNDATPPNAICSRSFSLLESISVSHCPKLKAVFSLSKDQWHLPNLKDLDVGNYKVLAYLAMSTQKIMTTVKLKLKFLRKL